MEDENDSPSNVTKHAASLSPKDCYAAVLRVLNQRQPPGITLNPQNSLYQCEVSSEIGSFVLTGNFSPALEFLLEHRLGSSETEVSGLSQQLAMAALLRFLNSLPARLPLIFMEWLMKEKTHALVIVSQESADAFRRAGHVLQKRFPSPDEVDAVFAGVASEIERAAPLGRQKKKSKLREREWESAYRMIEEMIPRVGLVRKDFREKHTEYRRRKAVRRHGYKPQQWLIEWMSYAQTEYQGLSPSLLESFCSDDKRKRESVYLASIHVAPLFGVKISTLAGQFKRHQASQPTRK